MRATQDISAQYLPRIVYRTRDDAADAAEVAAIANVYRFTLDCHAKKRDRLLDESGLADGTKTKGDSANVSSLPH